MHVSRAGRTLGSGRLVPWWGLALLVTALAACTSSPEPPSDPPRGVVDGRAPAGALLADPVADGQEERNTTFRVLLDLIAGTPAGERIRIVGNSFSYVPAAEALVEAHDRGVDVQVVLYDAPNEGWRAPEVLREGLGEDVDERSFVLLAPGGVHQKVWSFTRTGRSRDVTLTGSMNLTYHSAGQYTDMFSWVGRPDVRRATDRRFEQLVDGLPEPPPLGPLDLGDERVWFYPGYSNMTDPVRAQLAAVPPQGARIRVAMYAWLDERGVELAQQLADLDAAGADVEVVLGRSAGPLVRQVLEDSGVEIHPGVFAGGDDIHLKLTVVSAPGRRHDFVLTGSDNYTQASLGRPELLLRLEDSGAMERYGRWLDRIVARGDAERN